MEESRPIDPVVEAVRERILSDGVLLCVRLGAGAPVVEACRAAARGGLTVLEITLTTPGALRAIEALAGEEGLTVGAGTVLTINDARSVADAGGRFALSPVFDPDVVDEATRLGLLAVPGASTPTEIVRAHRHGALLVKVFPAGALGGPAFLRAIRGPLPGIPMVTTNGPTSETLGEYFAAGALAVGIGAEVLAPGAAPADIEAAAGRVRAAVDRFRAGR